LKFARPEVTIAALARPEGFGHGGSSGRAALETERTSLMRRTVLMTGFLAAVVAAAAVAMAAGASYYDKSNAAKNDGGLLSVLKPGQVIGVTSHGSAYELTISKTKILSKYKVVKVGGDYVVLTSEPKLLDLRIPVTSIKAIVHLKR